MKALQSMISKLEPFGMYSITDKSNIYNELSALGVGVDMLNDELSEMLSECFFATAKSYGLEIMERMWGKVQDDKTVSKRREMLLARAAFGFDDFTLSGVTKVLEILGVTGIIREYPYVCRVTVEVDGSGFSLGKRQWIQSQLEALFPAHLVVDAVYSGFDWEKSDEKNLDFYSMERKGYTWKQIDLLV